MEKYGLLTFKSTHFALQAETVFKEEEITFKTIPTPREVSQSCGLSLLFVDDYIGDVEKLVLDKKIDIDGLYKYSKEKHRGVAEKIM